MTYQCVRLKFIRSLNILKLFLNKMLVFYIVKTTFFVSQTKISNLYNVLENLIFLKFVGLRKGLTLM